MQAQTQPIFVKINDAKVLPSSSITSITQDKDGFIWIGTKNGLSCYDGNTYKIYNQTTRGLGADDVSAVYVDSKGRIWAGTLNGLQLLNKNEDKFISFKNLPVTDVCYQVGFSDRRYFSQMFKQKFGVTPSAYGKDLTVEPVLGETDG